MMVESTHQLMHLVEQNRKQERRIAALEAERMADPQ
jgi:hypothetical protein